jgi:thiol-disulfide isomerase/thioredoxin
MTDIKPYWFIITGLVLIYVFTLIVTPRRHRVHPYAPSVYPWFGPGGTRQLLGGIEQFDTGAKFYMFGVDWCPHCVSAKPLFEGMGPTVTIDGKSVALQYVNPEKEPQAAAGFEIDGYPTFYLEKDGRKLKYSGPRTADGFRGFLQQNL